MVITALSKINIMKCPICNDGMSVSFMAMVLCHHEATFDYCQACGFLRARDPHWLAEAYSSAITAADTGLAVRNISIARKLASILYFIFDERGQGSYVDTAGGSGMLTRLMRDYGFNFFWADKYAGNLLAKGFEYDQAVGCCRAVTAIEVMEHVEYPVAFIRDSLERFQSEVFIFTTELFEGAPPHADEWQYYSLETGQHISFFQRRTLEVIAEKMGLRFVSNGEIHILSKHPVNFLRLRLFAGRASVLGAYLARRGLGSRTMSDHENIARHSAIDKDGRS